MPFLDVFVNERPNIDESFTLIYLLFVFSSALSYLFGHYTLFLRASQKDYVTAAVTYTTTIVQSCVQIAVLLYTKNYIHYLTIQVVFLVFQYLFIVHLAICLLHLESSQYQYKYNIENQTALTLNSQFNLIFLKKKKKGGLNWNFIWFLNVFSVCD